MARVYRVTFENIAITGACDLVALYGTTGVVAQVKRAWLSATNTTPPTAQMLELRARYLPATVTTGVGTSATPARMDAGDAVAVCTSSVVNYTKATTNATAVTIEENGCHIFSGYDVPMAMATVIPGSAIVFELLSTPSGTANFSGGLEYIEIG